MNNEKNNKGNEDRNFENKIGKNGETIYNYGSDSSYGIGREIRESDTQQNPGGYSAMNYEPVRESKGSGMHVPEGVKRLFIRVGLILAMVCVFFVIKAMNDGEDTSEPESFTQSTPVYDENFYEDWREENESSDAADSYRDTEERITFRTDELLQQHYDKHGIEMGFASPEEYEEAAFAVICNPDALHKLEEEDGDHVYYVEETNEFVVVSTDGYIRTYFYPNAGIDYFNRQ